MNDASMDHLPRNAEILATRLAEVRGISPNEAIVAALQETLARTPERNSNEPRLKGDALIRRLEEISRQAAALPVLDPREADEILGYDEFGLPT